MQGQENESMSQMTENIVEQQIEHITESSVVLGAIFRELALRKANLPSADEATPEELINLSSLVAKSMGIESAVESFSAVVESSLVNSARKKAELTQDALAKRVGISRTIINQIENGKYLPSPGLRSKIHQELGIE